MTTINEQTNLPSPQMGRLNAPLNNKGNNVAKIAKNESYHKGNKTTKDSLTEKNKLKRNSIDKQRNLKDRTQHADLQYFSDYTNPQIGFSITHDHNVNLGFGGNKTSPDPPQDYDDVPKDERNYGSPQNMYAMFMGTWMAQNVRISIYQLNVMLLLFCALLHLSFRSRYTKWMFYYAVYTTCITGVLNTEFGSVLLGYLFEATKDLRDSYSFETPTEQEPEMEEVNPQSFMELDGKVSEIILLSVSALSGFKPKASFITGFDHYLKYNDNQRMNLSSSILFMSSKLSIFLDKVCHLDTLSEYFYIEKFENAKALKFRDNVANFIAEINIGKHFIKESSTLVYESFLQEGRIMLPVLDKKSFDFQMVTKIMRDLVSSHDKLIESFSPLGGERVEPVGILLRGKSAVMKSILMKRIGDLICRTTLPENWKEEYDKNPSGFNYIVPKGKYFDKYSYKSWVTYFDDIFQQRDAISTEESEALRIISMINSAPYLLTMAAVDQKNTTYFRSPFVLASSNLMNQNLIQSVVSTEAVFRRFAITVDVSVSPKYTNDSGKYLKGKLPKTSVAIDEEYLPDNTYVPNDFWVLKLIKTEGTNVVSESEVTFEELMVTIIQQYQDNVRTFYVNKTTNKRFADELSNKMNLTLQRDRFSKLFVKSSEVNKETLFEDTESENSDNFSLTIRAEVERQYRICTQDKNFEHNLVHSLQKRFGGNFMEITEVAIGGRNDLLYKLSIDECHELISALKAKDMMAITDTYINCMSRVCLADYEAQDFRHWEDDELYEIKTNSFNENFAKPMKKLLNFVLDHKFTILFFGGMLTTLIYYLMKKTAPLMDDVVTPQSVDLNRMKAPNKVGKTARIKTISQIGKKVDVHPQGFNMNELYIPELPKITSVLFDDTSTGGIADIKSVICNKYLYIIYIVRPEAPIEKRTIRVGHCTNIKSNYFEMALHFIYKLAEIPAGQYSKGAYIIMSSVTKRNNTRVFLNDFLEHFYTTDVAADNDRCIVHIPVMNANSPGIYRFLLKEDDLNMLKRTGGFKSSLLGTFHSDLQSKDLLLKATHFTAKFTGTAVAVKANWFDTDSHYALNETLSYNADTGDGDCGSIVFIENNQFNGRYVMGFHVAGGSGRGYANIVTQERVDQLFEVLEIKPQCFVDEEIPSYLISLPVTDKNIFLTPSYKVDPKILSNSRSFTELRRSAFHSRLPAPYNEVTTIPAKLNPFKNSLGELIDPWEIALKNYARESQPIPYSYLIGARDSYYDLIYQNDNTPLEGKDIIPLNIAIHAFEFVSSISPSTSAGVPYKFKDTVDLKKIYFKAIADKDQDKIESTLELIRLDVEETLDLYRKDIRPWSAFIDCLKDEKREKAKALAGSTRLFSAGSFNKLLVIGRMYFGSFMGMFTRLNMDLGTGIGLNPYSTDWDVMARRLLKFVDRHNVPKFGAGDYSKFDGSQVQAVLWLIYDIIERWYGTSDEEATKIRRYLWSEIVTSRHIFLGDVYDWDSSLPSGNWLTALINSIYNHLNFRLAYQFADLDIKMFNNNVILYVLGDDNIFSVSPDIEEAFNELTLPRLMALCGMQYTTEFKGVATSKFRKLEEIDFLKRSFRFDERLNRWVAPLQIRAIAEMLNWTKKGYLGDTIAVDNIGTALMELSLHGKPAFDWWAPQLLDLKKKYYDEIVPNASYHHDFKSAYSAVLQVEWFY